MKFIVEARHETFPPLFSMGARGMFEIKKERAFRFSDKEIAMEVATREKALRPGRKLLVIKVEE